MNRYYSVPYRLIGQRTQLVVSAQTLEVYHNHQRVAVHQRLSGSGQYATTKQHLPPAHRHMLDWTPDYFTEWAERIGPHTVSVIERLLSARKHPKLAHRSCLGILRQDRAAGAEEGWRGTFGAGL